MGFLIILSGVACLQRADERAKALKELESGVMNTDVEITETNVSDSAVKMKAKFIEEDSKSTSTFDSSVCFDSELGKQDVDLMTSPVKDEIDSIEPSKINETFNFTKKNSGDKLTTSGTKTVKKVIKKVPKVIDEDCIVDPETGSSWKPKVAAR